MKDVFKDIDRSHGTWYWETKPIEDYMIWSCPKCHKRTMLEERFIKPLLPKTIDCPYCDYELTLADRPEEDEKKEKK